MGRAQKQKDRILQPSLWVPKVPPHTHCCVSLPAICLFAALSPSTSACRFAGTGAAPWESSEQNERDSPSTPSGVQREDWLLINIVSSGQHGSRLAGGEIVGGACCSQSQETEGDRWRSVNKDTRSLPARCQSRSQPRGELSPRTCSLCVEQRVVAARPDVVCCDQKQRTWSAFARGGHEMRKGPRSASFWPLLVVKMRCCFPFPSTLLVPVPVAHIAPPLHAASLCSAGPPPKSARFWGPSLRARRSVSAGLVVSAGGVCRSGLAGSWLQFSCLEGAQVSVIQGFSVAFLTAFLVLSALTLLLHIFIFWHLPLLTVNYQSWLFGYQVQKTPGLIFLWSPPREIFSIGSIRLMSSFNLIVFCWVFFFFLFR